MSNRTLTIPAEQFPVGEYVADELAERGWTTADAAARLDGDRAHEQCWLDLLTCLPIWESLGDELLFSPGDADKLEQLFGVSAQTWLDLHESWLLALKAGLKYVAPKSV